MKAVSGVASKAVSAAKPGKKAAGADGATKADSSDQKKVTVDKPSIDPDKLSSKPEEFQVRVKIISAQQLSGSRIRPVVNVKIHNAPSQNTRIRKGSSPVWDKLMMFNFHESLKKLWDFEVEFHIKNSRKLRSDSSIGIFKLTMGRVYEQPNHAYVKKWLLLTNPNDQSNTPHGFLKITIFILGAGDQPPDESTEEDSDDVEKNLLTPAGATLAPAIFALRVYHADDLPQMDFGGLKNLLEIGEDSSAKSKKLVDPYLIFKFAGKKRETKVIEERNDPIWNVQLNLPLKFPSMCHQIKIIIKDRDRVGFDESVGTIMLPMSQISSTGENSEGAGYLPTFGPTFINMYGAPREFSMSQHQYKSLNEGKGEGCAYRGRVLLELSLAFHKKDKKKKVPKHEKINEELLKNLEKHQGRRRYRLLVCFLTANLIKKSWDDVEFEVSMGNIGNKFEADVQKTFSLTELSNPVFDGCRYYYMAWASKKPVMMLTAQWENVNFRHHHLNFLLRTIDRVNSALTYVKGLKEEGGSEREIASEIIEVLDTIILQTSKTLSDPRKFRTSNSLDIRLYQLRKKMMQKVCIEAKAVRESSSNIDDALTAVHDLNELLESVAYEPQSSIPDVIIWLISKHKRVAYYRIPANELLYCSENEEYSGMYCSKPLDITLKRPIGRKGKKKNEIPCQMRVIGWLGLTEKQREFSFHTRGQTAVYVDTFEMETKIPIRGWVSDGYKDVTGEITLPKSSFSCPAGCDWDGDWEVSTEANLLQDAGHLTFLEETFEYEQLQNKRKWRPDKVVNSEGSQVKSTESMDCPKGWEWEDDWAIDTKRACDEDGWQYSVLVEQGKSEQPWSPSVKPYHSVRRRRMLRTRKNVDPKALKKEEKKKQVLGEGWQYTNVTRDSYHPNQQIFDTVRRRKWIRRMVMSSGGNTALFNLETTLLKKGDLFPSLSSPTLTEAPPKVKALLGVPTDDGTGGKTDSLAASEGPKSKLPLPMIYLTYHTSSHLQLRAYIYQARDLLPMDADNYSDPVIFVSFLNHTRRTVVREKSLNPIWDQTLIMDINYFGDLGLLQNYCSDVMIEVFDRDLLVKTDRKRRDREAYNSGKPVKGSVEFMGRTTCQPHCRFSERETGYAKLRWYNIIKGEQPGGNILAAFEVYLKYGKQDLPLPPSRQPENPNAFRVPDGVRPVLQRTAIEFLIWGVRNLASYKLRAVDNPFVIIQIGEHMIKTEPITSLRKNSNFPTPFYFISPYLPVDPLYFPPILIRVKDNRKFGSRPTVGQYSIKNVERYQTKPLTKPVNKPRKPEPVDKAKPVAVEVDKKTDDEKSSKSDEEKSTKGQTKKDSKNKKDAKDKKKSKDKKKGKKDKKSEEGHTASDKDWWNKYYTSLNEQKGDRKKFAKLGLDLIKIYEDPLESQGDFKLFYDFIETFTLQRRTKGEEEEDAEIVGEFKGALKMYRLPADPTKKMPPKYFEYLPSSDPVDVKVRIYVVRGIDLAPQDSNGLSDPYLKIRAGKKLINDREHHLSNTLEPLFGRTFEMDLKFPMEKDLFVEVFDWDLIGTDDEIGRTVIDLETRYYSKYRAWCGLPLSYFTTGTTPWRDQRTPKEMLYEKACSEGWDEPVWNGNTAVLVNQKTYTLSSFESKMTPSPFWGEPEQRLCLYILRHFPCVSEHVETRPLFNASHPRIEQGRLHMWIDMFPKQFGDPGKAFDITARKPSKYVLRVIIWNCSNIPLLDKSLFGGKMTDIYIKGWLTGMESHQKKTDVHYRSMDGVGMFNWRFVFPFEYMPQEEVLYISKKEHHWSLDKTVTKLPAVLNIQAWDQDIFTPNEYISEISLPLNKMAKCSKFKRFCKLEDVPDIHGNCRMKIVSMFEQKMLKGWWPLYKEVDGKRKLCGKVEMTVEILTEEESKLRPAANARDKPNENPILAKPKRPATSFAWFTSPWKSLRYIIWRRYKWYIITLLAIIGGTLFGVFFFYAFPKEMARLITGA